MRKYLFKKAKYLIEKNKVKVDEASETHHSIRVHVGKHDVVLKYKNKGLIAMCSCRQGAFNGTCSHVLAAVAEVIKWVE